MSEQAVVNLGELSADDYIASRKAKPEAEVTKESVAAEAVETVSESEAGEAGEEKEEVVPEKKKGGGFQKRIDKLTKRIYELEGEIEKRAASGPEKAAKEPESAKKPKMEDFDDLESYVNALTEFNTEQKVSELKAKEAKESEDAEIREVYDSYNKRVAEFSAEHDDFEEVVGREDVKIPQAVQLAVVEMENGPEVAYFLANNLDVCKALGEMRPIRAVVEIGKIAAKLASPSPKQKPASTAPEPIRPVSGTARSVRPLSEIDDPDEYAKRRRAEKAASRRN